MATSLHNPALKQRHWHQMEKKMKQQLHFGESYFTLERVLAINPLKHSATITNVVQVAVGEQALAEMLDKVATLWRGVDLPVTSYKNSMDVFVMGDPEDIMTQVRHSHCLPCSLETTVCPVVSTTVCPVISTTVRLSQLLSACLN